MLIFNKLGHHAKVAQSLISSVMRAKFGIKGDAHPHQPEKPLVLYEFEPCPFARRVREAMTHLNLDYESRPCPRGGHVYRDELKELTGKGQIPYFIDKNTGEGMFESQDIINHLFANYSSDGVTPDKFQKAGAGGLGITNIGATLVSFMRGSKPANVELNQQRGKPELPLELYGFEASPFCRLVRERLSVLELGYINRSVAREVNSEQKGKLVKGGKRERLISEVMGGKIQVPYLIDPNTDIKMLESKDIIEYLDKTYGSS